MLLVRFLFLHFVILYFLLNLQPFFSASFLLTFIKQFINSNNRFIILLITQSPMNHTLTNTFKQIQSPAYRSLSFCVVIVDLCLGGIQSESNESWNDNPAVLGGCLGVFWFIRVLIWDFWKVYFGDVEWISSILGESLFRPRNW